MPRRIVDWVRRRFGMPDGDKKDDGVQPEPRRRFRPFKGIRDRIRKMWQNISNILPGWAAGFLLQGFLILLGAPWWVWPVIAIAAWALFGGFF